MVDDGGCSSIVLRLAAVLLAIGAALLALVPVGLWAIPVSTPVDYREFGLALVVPGLCSLVAAILLVMGANNHRGALQSRRWLFPLAAALLVLAAVLSNLFEQGWTDLRVLLAVWGVCLAIGMLPWWIQE